jgi:diadenosine tetraphosphate (Ap4A) HIT family hydrolase
MEMGDLECLLCDPEAADREMRRVQVWEDDLWRLTVSLFAEVPGFSVLEPKRHIPYIADLEGAEAQTFGPVMARVSSVLREVTSAEQVFVYVFGEGIAHLHVHLAPHREGDALNDIMVKGELVEQKELESGAGYYVSKDYPPLPEDELAEVAERIRARLLG